MMRLFIVELLQRLMLHMSLAVACATLGAASARAQTPADISIDSNRIVPPIGPSDFTTLRSSSVPPHFQFFGATLLVYQHRPVVLSEQDAGEFEALATQLDAHVLFGIGLLDRLQIAAALPLRLIQSGVGVAPLLGDDPETKIDVIRLGDVRLAADWRIGELSLGDERRLGILVSAGVVAPMGDSGRFTSGDAWVLTPTASADLSIGRLLFGIDAGARFNSDTRELGAARFGNELLARAGIAWFPTDDAVSLSLEGGAIFELAEQPPESTQSQHVYDAGMGLRWTPSPDYTIRSALSIGAGGLGAPAFRFLLGVEYGARPITTLQRR